MSSGHPLLDTLRQKLATRGAGGLLGMSRLFKLMDVDGSGTLDLNEFKKAMRDLTMGIKEPEVGGSGLDRG